MNSNKKLTLALVLTGNLLTFGCGGSDPVATSTDSGLSTTMAAMAVTSPTAATSTTSFQLRMESKSRLAQWGNKALHFFLPLSHAESAPNSEIKPIDTMVSDLKTDLASSTPAAIAAKIGNMSVTSYRANCYGPSWTDNATGSSVNRPSGDLGMVAANASSTDTTACAAAELNSLIGGAPQFANKLIKLQATLVAALKTAGKTLPAVGESKDGLADMPALTGITLTAATLSRLSDRTDGRPVYKTVINFTNTSSKTGTVTIYHTPVNDDNSNFTGLIQAVLPHTPTSGSGTKRGLSMVYTQTDGVFTYALDTAANQTTDSADFFNTTTGRVDFSKAAFGEDGNRIVASFNSTTHAGTMHYAWQAGANDNAVRAFAVSIAAGTEGSLTGFGYFGFGVGISSITSSPTTPWMTKMFCNWLNGLANGTSVTKVQGQTFQQTGGKYVVVTSKINFAPTDTCASGSNYTVSSSLPTDYNGSRSGTNDLATMGDLGTVPAVTVPTYTPPSS